MLNTVIFLIAGTKLGVLLADHSFSGLFRGDGIIMIASMYFIILFARG